MDLHTVLVLGHIIGTVLGVGGATFIEIHLNMALKDGKMEPPERLVMGYDFLVVRIGLALGLLTGMGLIYPAIISGNIGRFDGVFWAKMAIIVILMINAVLLHKHKIGLYWGSALSFVSWWSALILGVFLSNSVKFIPSNKLFSFLAIMGVYAFMVISGAWILHHIRELTKAKVIPPQAPTPGA